MKAEELIQDLSGSIRPIGKYAVGRRVVGGLIAGGLVTLLAVGVGLGLRRDLWGAMHGAAFWMKWAYVGSLTLCALVATVRLGHPDTGRLTWLWLMVIPPLGLAAVSIAEMSRTPNSEWLAMWLGGSWKVCSLLVFMLSIPIAAGLLWSYQNLAPTRLRWAGAAVGLTAGAASATLYCLHCPEASALFVLTWYTIGIALAAVTGALLGPRLLRW